MPNSENAAMQLSLTSLAAKARDLKTMRLSGTAFKMRAQSRTTRALTLATLLKLPNVMYDNASEGGGDTEPTSGGGV
eukprot:3214282-Rhodomonas_salina.2